MDEQGDNIVRKMREEKRPTETLEWRVSNIEKHNQIRKISSEDGDTYFDTELGIIEINDPNGLGKITIGQGKIIVTDENDVDRVLIGDLS